MAAVRGRQPLSVHRVSSPEPLRSVSVHAPVARSSGTLDLYALALAGDEVQLRTADGSCQLLDAARWLGRARHGDLSVLDRLKGPVLDVGCGPGRFVVALTERGIPALGLDIAPEAVRRTQALGAMALRRSVFATVPGQGCWTSVLLADGNIGIGGDPVRLLRRTAELIAPDGEVVVELQGTGWRTGAVRLEQRSQIGEWFAWSSVGVDAIGALARDAGLRPSDAWGFAEDGGVRSFVVLTPAGSR